MPSSELDCLEVASLVVIDILVREGSLSPDALVRVLYFKNPKTLAAIAGNSINALIDLFNIVTSQIKILFKY